MPKENVENLDNQDDADVEQNEQDLEDTLEGGDGEDKEPEDKSKESESQDDVDPDEEVARAKGWRPKDEWEGDPKKWVEADEFLRRGELFEKIESQGRELKETKRVLEMLKKHHAQVKESEYNRALEEVRARKRQGLAEGDADAVLKADEDLMDLKAAKRVQADDDDGASREPHPTFARWVERNSWYAQNAEMRTMADDIGTAHAKAHPEKAPEQVLEYVETRIRKVYSDKFKNPMRKRPSPVDGQSRDTSVERKENDDSFELTAEERKVMNTFVNDGVMTKDQYIAEIKQLRGVR